MSVFDTLAENRYQQWLEDTSKPGYQPPKAVSQTATRTSFEAQLYQQAIDLLKAAAAIDTGEKYGDTRRQALLTQVNALQFQLCVSLEKKDLPLVAKTLSSSIRQHQHALGLTSSMS